jgi:general secretion pathway protein I
MKRSRGFTLLEIIIALAIAALAITAVAKAIGSAATVAGETEERMLAVWAASNRLSELRITRAWPAPGNSEATSTMGGRTWYLAQTVSDTDNPDVRRVEVSVFTDVRHSVREYQAFGYVARYQPEQESQSGTQGGTQNDGNGGSSGTNPDNGQGTGAGDATPTPGQTPEPSGQSGNGGNG